MTTTPPEPIEIHRHALKHTMAILSSGVIGAFLVFAGFTGTSAPTPHDILSLIFGAFLVFGSFILVVDKYERKPFLVLDAEGIWTNDHQVLGVRWDDVGTVRIVRKRFIKGTSKFLHFTSLHGEGHLILISPLPKGVKGLGDAAETFSPGVARMINDASLRDRWWHAFYRPSSPLP